MLMSLFSFFRSKPKNKAPVEKASSSSDAPATQMGLGVSQRMTLEERKNFRREMLYQSIRETFLSMNVIGSMYKFKVMPVDERHHRFIAMFDVGKTFVLGDNARTHNFGDLERAMRTNAYKRYGIVIEATYWRVNDWENQFEQKNRVTDAPTATAAAATPTAPTPTGMVRPPRPPRRAMQVAASTPPPVTPGIDDVSEDEVKAFMNALTKGKAPPPLHVGDKEYESDAAPLDGGIMIGGTQYGKL
jgi:hypothetical protein